MSKGFDRSVAKGGGSVARAASVLFPPQQAEAEAGAKAGGEETEVGQDDSAPEPTGQEAPICEDAPPQQPREGEAAVAVSESAGAMTVATVASTAEEAVEVAESEPVAEGEGQSNDVGETPSLPAAAEAQAQALETVPKVGFISLPLPLPPHVSLSLSL